jgi:CMP-N-acetylneuraminic acid synthetase
LYKSKSFFNFPVYPFIMDDYQSIDIDKEIDFKLAEIYLNN